MKDTNKPRREFFGSGQLRESFSEEDLDARIVSAIRCMVTKATSNLKEINEAVKEDSLRELSRGFASEILNYLASEGIDIRTGRMMDLGAGLGMLSEEAAVRGANPVAVEPGSGYREIALDRIRRGGNGAVIAAVGESLPFRDNSFDVIISLEVLEHVEDPAAVLGEVVRILKPGGWFYVSCPNYLSFREVHYNVAWLPLLPKPLGSLYLRLRRRPTEFLQNSITYVTRPGVRRQLRALGLQSVRDRHISAVCRSPSLVNHPWKRAVLETTRRFVSADVLVRAIAWLDQAVFLCTPSIAELVQKPNSPQS
jgi:2-polyprenyl-3-methyl-5-hydroxy-6-metoxy-1,4-benzoquinol methylase